LLIGIDLLHTITGTGDGLLKFVNIDDLEWPWISKRGVLVNFFAMFSCSELRRNGWRLTKTTCTWNFQHQM